MMTNRVSYGKPDAGKPHVRFDEGEVASATPRRGSLLYKRVGKLVLGALAAACCAGMARAESISCTWTGAADGRWSNVANWVVTGTETLPSRVPGVISNADAFVEGVFTPERPTGDTAIFSGVTDGAATTIDLTGLYSIGNVRFTGANCPKYTLGDAAAVPEGQNLATSLAQYVPIEPSGCFAVDASVVEAPLIACPFSFQANVDHYSYKGPDPSDPTKTTTLYCKTVKEISITNDSASVLHFAGTVGHFLERPLAAGQSKAWVQSKIYVYGAGDFSFDNTGDGRNGRSFGFYSYVTGRFYFNESNNIYQQLNFYRSTTVDIAAGKKLYLCQDNSTYLYNLASDGDKTLTINGPGSFGFYDRHYNAVDGRGCLVTDTGRTTIFNCPVYTYNDNSGYLTADHDFILATSGSGSLCVLNCPTNDINGSLVMQNTKNFVKAASVGSLPQRGVIVHSGSAEGELHLLNVTNETYAGNIAFTNSVDSTSGRPHVKIFAEGTGALTLTGELTATELDSGRVVLTATAAPITFAGSIAGTHHPCLEVATAPYAVTINGAATFVEGSELRMAGGVVNVTGDVTIGKVTCTVVSKLNVAAGKTLTLGTVADLSKQLNVILDKGATLHVADSGAVGSQPANLYVNGLAASVDVNGNVTQVVPAATVTIPAKGGVVTNGEEVVAIATAGTEGAITLSAAETHVTALEQVSDTAAEVAFETAEGAAANLTAEGLYLSWTGKDLAVGNGTAGELKSTGAMTVQNDSPDSTLTVAPQVFKPAGTVTVQGVGTTVFRDLTWTQTVEMTMKGIDSSDPAYVATRKFENVRIVRDPALGADSLRFDKTAAAAPIYASEGGVAALEITGTDTVISNAVIPVKRLPSSFPLAGAVYLRGGLIEPRYEAFGVLGEGGAYGYLEIDGGTYKTYGSTFMGGNSYNAFQHVFALKSGKFIHANNSSLRVGVGNGVSSTSPSLVVAHQTGGTLESNGFNLRDWGGYENIHVYYTAQGKDALVKCGTGAIQMAFGNGGAGAGCCTVFNINDAARVESGRIYSNGREPQRANYVNFNGGTYCAKNSTGVNGTGVFGGDANDTSTRVDRVTVNAKGAVFEVPQNNSAAVWTALEKPTGLGVTAIGMPTRVDRFVGPPTIRIVGDGTGATAAFDFDSTQQKITGITITSPGWGYTEAYAECRYGNCFSGATSVFTLPVTLGTVAGGPVVKTGAGILAFHAKNTYAGPLIISNGTVQAMKDNVFPDDGVVQFEGGTLNLNNTTQATIAGVEGTAGTVTGGTLTLSGVWTFDAATAGTRTVPTVTGNVTFGAGSVIEVVHPAALDLEKAGGYALFKVASGNTISGAPSILFAETYGKANLWSVKKTTDSVSIYHVRGTTVILR